MSVIKTFMPILRLGIGHRSETLPQAIDWLNIINLAERQGVSAILMDGIEKLPDDLKPPKLMLLEWIGVVIQYYEYRYVQYRQAISEIAGFFNNHGYKMMVLKGYACSLNWPKPEHRPCGDIDIWQFGKQKEADELLKKEKGIKVDNSEHHHTIFFWGDFKVENHYDFINVHARKSNRDLETLFKKLGEDDSYIIEINNERVYLPSPNLHALFLIRHLAAHFTSTSVTLRQVLDWAFFVEKHTKEIDWNWLEVELEKLHLSDFVNSLNAICVEDLGFSSNIFQEVRYLPVLKDKIFADIMNPEFGEPEPNSFIPRLLYKYKRWKGNAWKQKMCFNESLLSGFWTGLWSHLLKPRSI